MAVAVAVALHGRELIISHVHCICVCVRARWLGMLLRRVARSDGSQQFPVYLAS